jgi:hypothetical protein
MTQAEIEWKIAEIRTRITSTQESIAELLECIPDARPYPELYKTAQYLEKFNDSLEIGKKNIDRLTGGGSVLPLKRYA